MRTVRVTPPAATAEPYEIRLAAGALDQLGGWLKEVYAGPRFVIIADSNVAALHGERVRAHLARAAAAADLFVMPAGEENKTRAAWGLLTDEMLRAGVGRDACVVALGGGVTGDVAGFVAATFMRGIPWVQVPTSLLAMIDASIGGKTGVDVPGGKNLVGAFHQPRLVVIDPFVLETLPRPELGNGLAEAVKHGAVADNAYHDWIRASAGSLLNGEAAALEELIERSIRIKAAVVSEDPLERGVRAILNFGHTVAHAVEWITHFEVPHGQAVALGMVAEARIGEAAGITEAGSADELGATLRALGLPVVLPEGAGAGQLMAAAAADKKTRDARMRWALIRRIGEAARTANGAWTHDIPDEIVERTLAS